MSSQHPEQITSLPPNNLHHPFLRDNHPDNPVLHALPSTLYFHVCALAVSPTPALPATMSPGLKPLLLPQLVEEKRKLELQRMDDRTNSVSSSDLTSPVTPTFARTHLRFSTSLSSLSSVSSESPVSPTQPTHPTNKSKSQLPDVQEDPLERDEDDTIVADDATGLYDCLCKYALLEP